MDDEADPNPNTNSPIPGLEQSATDAPMHYLFEIQLMTKLILGEAPAENRANHVWMVKTQHVRRYLVNYYREHTVLPTDRRYLGMTRPLNLEVGMVDFDAIRQKIRADAEARNGMNLESPEDIENVADYPQHSEIEAGKREQIAEQEPNQVIFDLRQTLTRRGKKGN
jgi:hypothetical protein